MQNTLGFPPPTLKRARLERENKPLSVTTVITCFLIFLFGGGEEAKLGGWVVANPYRTTARWDQMDWL